MEHTIAQFLTNVSTNNLTVLGIILFFLAPYLLTLAAGVGGGWILWQNTKALTLIDKHIQDCNRVNDSLKSGVDALNEHLTSWESYKKVQDDTLSNVKDTKQLVIQAIANRG